MVPLPAGAVSALAAAITPRYELAVWLAAGAGLRKGEALGLTAPRVEFLARLVCARCAPESDRERAAAGQGQGGGRVGL